MATYPPPGRVADLAYLSGSRFAREAWRLEVLDEYDSPLTRQRVARFLAGEGIDPAPGEPWYAMVREASAAGKRVGRVHVVSEPLTDYLRFELAAYRMNQAAGEEIRVMPRGVAEDLGLPPFDFWLLDGIGALVLYYGARGAFLRAELVTDPGFTDQCQAWRDLAISNATPLDEYTEGRAAA